MPSDKTNENLQNIAFYWEALPKWKMTSTMAHAKHIKNIVTNIILFL